MVTRPLPEPRNNKQKLLKFCLESKAYMDKLLEAIEPVRGKTDAEIEVKCAEVLERFLSEDDSNQKSTPSIQ